MKSLLVDAMRQANKGDNDEALSDSGSFDTTTDQFTETANDAVVEAPQPHADDLQLLDPDAPGIGATDVEALGTGADAVAVALPELESPEPANGRELSAELAAFDVAVPAVSRAPSLSRLSPAICLALFFAAGLAWSGWQYWQTQVAGEALGASRILGAPTPSAASAAATGSEVELFPFIVAAEPASGVEAEE